MENLTIDIITAETALLTGATITSVTAPGVQGAFQVLPGHTTFLTELEAGPVTVEAAEGSQQFVIRGGFAEVMQGHIRILADQATSVDAVDTTQVAQSLQDLAGKLEATDPYSQEAASLQSEQRYLQAQQELR